MVVSFGDVAASGGYYISCPADKIVASPNTITGSIGIFGMIPNVGELLHDKLDISTDVVKTNENSDLLTLTRPMTSHEKMLMQNCIDLQGFRNLEGLNYFLNSSPKGRPGGALLLHHQFTCKHFIIIFHPDQVNAFFPVCRLNSRAFTS